VPASAGRRLRDASLMTARTLNEYGQHDDNDVTENFRKRTPYVFPLSRNIYSRVCKRNTSQTVRGKHSVEMLPVSKCPTGVFERNLRA